MAEHSELCTCEECQPIDFYTVWGEPWCRFGRGLVCLNGDDCRNPNHRKEATPWRRPERTMKPPRELN